MKVNTTVNKVNIYDHVLSADRAGERARYPHTSG
jgi:hypothetical protein